MKTLADRSVEEMRKAAQAWRVTHDKHEPKSLHDRIDELLDEIERLRALKDKP